jgi:hypothetical protein
MQKANIKCNCCGYEYEDNKKLFQCADCDTEICENCRVVHIESQSDVTQNHYCSKCYYDNHWKYRPNKKRKEII